MSVQIMAAPPGAIDTSLSPDDRTDEEELPVDESDDVTGASEQFDIDDDDDEDDEDEEDVDDDELDDEE